MFGLPKEFQKALDGLALAKEIASTIQIQDADLDGHPDLKQALERGKDLEAKAHAAFEPALKEAAELFSEAKEPDLHALYATVRKLIAVGKPLEEEFMQLEHLLQIDVEAINKKYGTSFKALFQ